MKCLKLGEILDCRRHLQTEVGQCTLEGEGTECSDILFWCACLRIVFVAQKTRRSNEEPACGLDLSQDEWK